MRVGVNKDSKDQKVYRQQKKQRWVNTGASSERVEERGWWVRGKGYGAEVRNRHRWNDATGRK